MRFYVTDQLRQNDIGYLTFGTDTTEAGLTLPPQMQSLAVDSYCPGSVTAVCVSLFDDSSLSVLILPSGIPREWNHRDQCLSSHPLARLV